LCGVLCRSFQQLRIRVDPPVLLATSFIDRFLGQFGYAAVFGFVGIESLGVPFPGETMLISAALYAGATHNLSIVGVIVTAAAGAIVGDNIGFGVGHWGGYRLLLRYGHYIRLHEGRVKLARYLFQQHGGKVVFFGRFVSVLRTYAAFLAGTARMPWLHGRTARAPRECAHQAGTTERRSGRLPAPDPLTSAAGAGPRSWKPSTTRSTLLGVSDRRRYCAVGKSPGYGRGRGVYSPPSRSRKAPV
jgi:membrane protein YqaA with SNARE-associated domain